MHYDPFQPIWHGEMTGDARQDPDVLLASIQREEAKLKRGRLKVFLGMCPGVGKTFAMLDAACG